MSDRIINLPVPQSVEERIKPSTPAAYWTAGNAADLYAVLTNGRRQVQAALAPIEQGSGRRGENIVRWSARHLAGLLVGHSRHAEAVVRFVNARLDGERGFHLSSGKSAAGQIIIPLLKRNEDAAAADGEDVADSLNIHDLEAACADGKAGEWAAGIRALGTAMRPQVDAARRKLAASNSGVTPVGVTIGDDLPRVLPHELALRRHNAVEFARRYAERGLAQRVVAGETPHGGGHLLVMMDASLSMGDSVHDMNSKLIYATAYSRWEVAFGFVVSLMQAEPHRKITVRLWGGREIAGDPVLAKKMTIEPSSADELVRDKRVAQGPRYRYTVWPRSVRDYLAKFDPDSRPDVLWITDGQAIGIERITGGVKHSMLFIGGAGEWIPCEEEWKALCDGRVFNAATGQWVSDVTHAVLSP